MGNGIAAPASPSTGYSVFLLSDKAADAIEADLQGFSVTEISDKKQGELRLFRLGCFPGKRGAEKVLKSLAGKKLFVSLGKSDCAPALKAPFQEADKGTSQAVARSADTSAPRAEPPYQQAPWINQPLDSLQAPAEFKTRLQAIFTKLATLRTQESEYQIADEILSRQCRSETLANSERQLLAARKKQLASDPGLAIEASSRVQLSPGSQLLDDEFKNRQSFSYLGLGWDLLRDGQLENTTKARVLEQELQLHQLQASSRNLLEQRACRTARLTQHFSRAKVELLDLFEQLLTVEQGILAGNYFAGSLTLDDVLRGKSRSERIRQKLHQSSLLSYLPTPEKLPLPVWGEPPLIDIRLDELLAAVMSDPKIAETLNIRQQISSLQRNPWLEARLKFYLRQGYNWDISAKDQPATAAGGHEYPLTAGLLFSMPIFNGKDEVYRAEDGLRHVEASQRLLQTLDEVQRYHTEFAAVVDDGIKLHYQREEVLERMRRALLLNRAQRSDSANLGALTQAARDLVETQIELLDNRQRLYVSLVNVFAAAQVDFQAQLIRPLVLESKNAGVREGKRGIYVWSVDFNRFDNPTLADIAHAKKFSTLLVSARQRTNTAKLQDLLKNAGSLGVEVTLIGGAPAWVKQERHDKVVAMVQAWFRDSNSVHLDIEPHLLPEWRQDRGALVEGFSRLLARLAADRRPDQKLSIALPLTLTREEIATLAPHVDKIVVMAYETASTDRIVQRMERYADVPKEKLAIALRPDDYQDEAALEFQISALQQRLQIHDFMIHDLKRLLEITR